MPDAAGRGGHRLLVSHWLAGLATVSAADAHVARAARLSGAAAALLDAAGAIEQSITSVDVAQRAGDCACRTHCRSVRAGLG